MEDGLQLFDGFVGEMKHINKIGSSCGTIEGLGTILFTCKTGEHCTLAGIYYIPWLTASIVSLGQLDEDDYKIDIDKN